ncbi:ribonuclease HIII [Enterococcus mundtii]|uniref:ribonuclease HIII n=1 Tax=Enterococcus TaxID=1350 RepID=UPI000451EC5E|nr:MULTISPECIES: ribonuclease HIII [Enterococcus]AZP93340.1 ribonuclease HIII [Enterococcus mundtii]EYT96730.1 ribonuclease HIII [Enterococcus mundtii CRL35]MDA9429985.1 Ribonuclease HIII [Enterococcus mundtii 1A]MDK4210395.1 ribonuclease HIII [Enterococcus mundtii]MDO7879179.1 ribonuclease HIII [Enterococcus mundtii]
MSNIILKVTKNQISKMKEAYRPFLVQKPIPYTLFSAKKNGTTITAYTSGKVMFQGTGAEQEAAKWGNPLAAKNSTQTNSSSLPKDLQTLSVLGSDEVGNGSYFGPLTVCAAYVDQTQLKELRTLGVKDSKELKDGHIIQLAKVLKNTIPYQLLVLPPKKYNEIQPTYNAVRMKVALHNQAIHLLLQKIAPVKPDAILIDQFTPEANFKKYARLEKNQLTEKLYFVTKGEQYHLAVAAASIISRASFLEELDKESAELGLTLPSGAGTKSDQVAATILKKGGEALLANYAKLHFANTEKAKKLVN